jgi:hypothetical protein
MAKILHNYLTFSKDFLSLSEANVVKYRIFKNYATYLLKIQLKYTNFYRINLNPIYAL